MFSQFHFFVPLDFSVLIHLPFSFKEYVEHSVYFVFHAGFRSQVVFECMYTFPIDIMLRESAI